MRTDPAANAVVARGPAQVMVESSEPVDLQRSSVVVYSSGHKPMAGAPVRVGGDPDGLVVAVPSLPKGVYTIVWHLTGATGGSLGDGSSAFQVDPKGASPTVVQHAKPAPVSSPARKVLARWLSFLFVMVFIGALAVRFFVTAPAARRAPEADRASLLQATDRRVLVVAGVALAAFVPAVWAELANESNAKLGFWQAARPARIWKFLSAGAAGHLWEARLVLVALAAVAVLPAAVRAMRDRSAGLAKAAPLMLVGLAAGAGEMLVSTIPSTRPTARALPRAAFTALLDLGHLLGAAMWVGGLVALVALAAVALPAGLGARFWPRAVPRFSMAATVSLGVLVLTGLWTAWIHVGSPSLLVSTTYGERLLLKLVLVAALALLGSFNLFWVLPRVEAFRHPDGLRGVGGGGGGRGTVGFAGVMHHFRRTIAIEAVLGVAILAVVPFLSGSARNQAFQAKAADLTQTVRSGRLAVSLAPSGRQVGFTDYDVRLPKATAGRVSVGFASSELGVPETDVVATSVGDGRYRVTGLYTPMVGRWQVRVSAAPALSATSAMSAVFDVKVVASAPKLAKSKPPKVHAATWEWGIFDLVAVVVVLFGANRVSRRLSARRARATRASPTSPGAGDSPSPEPELASIGAP